MNIDKLSEIFNVTKVRNFIKTFESSNINEVIVTILNHKKHEVNKYIFNALNSKNYLNIINFIFCVGYYELNLEFYRNIEFKIDVIKNILYIEAYL